MRQVLTEGAVAGFPLQDMRVIVYDGKHHAVDSKEVAFVSAGRKAFLDGVRRRRPDRARAGGARGDDGAEQLDRRHHRRPRDASRAHRAATKRSPASAPASARSCRWPRSREYQSRLKSLTGGEGAYTMELSHYDPVPPRKQQELMKAFKTVEEE